MQFTPSQDILRVHQSHQPTIRKITQCAQAVRTSFTRPSGSLAPRQYKLHHTTPHIQRCIPMLPPLTGRPIEQPSATPTRLWRATARSAPCQCHTTNGLCIVNPCILASVPDRKPPLQLRSAAAADAYAPDVRLVLSVQRRNSTAEAWVYTLVLKQQRKLHIAARTNIA